MKCNWFVKCMESISPEETTEKHKNKKNDEHVPPCKHSEQLEKCVRFADRRSEAKCHENGKEYIYNQSSKEKKDLLICARIDDGVINGKEAKQVQKCDFSMTVKGDKNLKKIYLIEMKGTDITKAYCQLKSTVDLLGLCNLIRRKVPVYGRIVSSKVPGTLNEQLIKMKQTWKKENLGDLKIKGKLLVDEVG